MPERAGIGFQSNGVLLDTQLSEELIEAGLSTLCLSVDEAQDPAAADKNSSRGHSFAAVETAVSHLARAREKTGRRLKIGLEMVLHQANVEQLPALVDWAAGCDVDYILVSHLIHCDVPTGHAKLFNPNSSDAAQLFNKVEATGARSDSIRVSTLRA